MIVLVINNGSTSCRFSVINTKTKLVLAQGGSENIGTSTSYFKYENYKGQKDQINIDICNCSDSLKIMNSYIFSDRFGIFSSYKDIDVIGHRVVHGGMKYTSSTVIDEAVLADILLLSNIAPLHNSKAIEAITKCKEMFKNIYNVGVFDTAFHSTIPPENYLYAIPKEFYEKYGIRRYGFHGISYSYVLNRYSEMIDKDINFINTVMCHLGGGSSICAIKNGKSFDTTMGYTPLSGLIMASRSGNVDPAVIPAIMKNCNISADEVLKILNSLSGYFAICGEKNVKSIVERSESGEFDAILLRKMINTDFKRNLLSMMANLDRVDSIILTGGISAKNKEQREMLMSGLEQFGLILDREKNNNLFDTEAVISTKESRIPIYLIPTNEELEIANECEKVMIKRL